MTSGPNGGGNDWASPGSSATPPGWSSDQPPPQYPPTQYPPAQYPPPQYQGQHPGAPAPGGWGYGPPPPPRPGIIPLRPLGVGELLDGSFTAIRRYPRATLGLAACVMLVVNAVQVLVQWYLLSGLEAPGPNETLSGASDYFARFGTAASLSAVVTAVGTLLLTGLVTAVIGEAVLGRPVSAGDAWQRLKPLFWRLIGVTVLTFLILAGVGAACVLPGILVLAAGSEDGGVALLVIGGITGVVVAVWLYISLALAPAIVVLERQPVRAALRRSRALVQRSWWRVFGILILASIIASVVGGIISLPFGLAGGGLSSIGDNSSDVTFGQLVLSGLGGLVAGTLVRPFSAGVAALLYIDRRMRAEALDLTLARAAASSPE